MSNHYNNMFICLVGEIGIRHLTRIKTNIALLCFVTAVQATPTRIRRTIFLVTFMFSPAPTGLCAATSQNFASYDFFIAAFAPAQPRGITALIVRCATQDSEPIECAAGYIGIINANTHKPSDVFSKHGSQNMKVKR